MTSDRKLRDLYAYPDLDRAWVRANFVSTVDGSAQSADGTSGALGGEPDHRAYQVMRSLADVVLVGAGTARAERYAVADVPIAVATRSLNVPPALVAPRQLVITTASSPADKRAELARTMDVIVAGDDAIDWHAVLDAFVVRGLPKVLCEGGPTLHGTLLGLGLVDEVCLTIAPTIVVGAGPRIALSAEPVSQPMQLAHVIDEDGVLLTRWLKAQQAARV